MRKLLLACFLVLTWPAIAQSQKITDSLTISQIPETGLALHKGWKYQPGDNMAWKEPGFNDEDWEKINPIVFGNDFHKHYKSAKGWLRRPIKMDSTLNTNHFALIIRQSVASEIYLDGKLIKRLGVIGDNKEKTIAYSPAGIPIEFYLKPGQLHTLTIRYAFQPDLYYQPKWLLVNINTYKEANKIYTAYLDGYKNMVPYLVLTGMLFILFALHTSFYLFYPKDKTNFYYALNTLFYGIGITCAIVLQNSYEIANRIFLNDLSTFSYATFLFFILTIYHFFKYPNRQVFKFIVLLFVTLLTFYFIKRDPFLINLVPIIMILESLRVIYWAYKRQVPGAKILLFGFLPSLILYLVALVFSFTGNPNPFLFFISFAIASIGLPLFISIFIALRFANNNKSLEQNLKEVKQLSEKTLIQEQEKQIILANQKANLEDQVKERTLELENSLTTLKTTQTQLIQSEKMASLGELTAGIAHEIQNPLNFVNNFSEVSAELLEELEEELQKGDTAEALVLAADVKGNLVKISHHGKRADSIVKGMLEHSRTTSGKKELTDINALADEYLRLSYHGLRAKDKSFNAAMVTDFAPDLTKVAVVPQDLGRVLLNLFNNAFYAVQQKRQLALTGEEEPHYQPQVRVSTKIINNQIQIQIRDNGMGIPENILNKIFQPFFTTKPTGEGTGLGLSLSYDIITKGHGGTMTAQTEDGQYAEFEILLPV